MRIFFATFLIFLSANVLDRAVAFTTEHQQQQIAQICSIDTTLCEK